jgi:hypothetical protein
MIVTFVGIGVALENWAAPAGLIVVPTVGILVRIRYEERLGARRERGTGDQRPPVLRRGHIPTLSVG